MEWKHAALKLVLLITFIFLLQQVFPVVTEFAVLRPSQFAFKPWTILTAVFIHADYSHLFNNMFFLAVFGYMLEHYIGVKHFLAVFLVGGVLANLSAFIFYTGSGVLGASGAVSAVIATLAVLRPRNPGLFFGVPVPMWAALLGWIGTNVLGAAAGGGTTAFEAHLFGLGIGLVTGLYYRDQIVFASKQKERDTVDIPESVIREWEKQYME